MLKNQKFNHTQFFFVLGQTSLRRSSIHLYSNRSNGPEFGLVWSQVLDLMLNATQIQEEDFLDFGDEDSSRGVSTATRQHSGIHFLQRGRQHNKNAS